MTIDKLKKNVRWYWKKDKILESDAMAFIVVIVKSTLDT